MLSVGFPWRHVVNVNYKSSLLGRPTPRPQMKLQVSMVCAHRADAVAVTSGGSSSFLLAVDGTGNYSDKSPPLAAPRSLRVRLMDMTGKMHVRAISKPLVDLLLVGKPTAAQRMMAKRNYEFLGSCGRLSQSPRQLCLT